MNNDLYIDLIKKTLIDYQKIGYTEYKPLYKNNDTWQLKFAIALDKLFRKNKLAICKFSQSTIEKRLEGKDWPANADSMVGMKRLDIVLEKLLKITLKEILLKQVFGAVVQLFL